MENGKRSLDTHTTVGKKEVEETIQWQTLATFMANKDILEGITESPKNSTKSWARSFLGSS